MEMWPKQAFFFSFRFFGRETGICSGFPPKVVGHIQCLQFFIFKIFRRSRRGFVFSAKITFFESCKPLLTCSFFFMFTINFVEKTLCFSSTFLPVKTEKQNFPQMLSSRNKFRHLQRTEKMRYLRFNQINVC